MDELPNPLARTLSELEPMDKGGKSKLLARVAKSALKNFIRGICENQVEISWGAGLPPDVDDDHEVSIEDLSMLDIQALPPHPQDLKNERKIAELNHWKTRSVSCSFIVLPITKARPRIFTCLFFPLKQNVI
jgi:hypothetical protein